MRLMILGISISILSAGAALGQTTRPEPLPADQMLNQMLNNPQANSTTHPSTRRHSDVAISLNRGTGGAKLIREGTEIYDRPGHLQKRDDGLGQEFIFDDDGAASPMPNMIVLSDLKLMSIENAQTTTSRNLNFVASGVVTEYKGRNYLLLESSPDDTARRNEMPAPRPVTTGKPRAANDMLNDMLSGPPRPPAAPAPTAGPMTDSTSGGGAVAPAAPVLTVMREGSQIVDRIGRLTHSSDGQQAEFTFDSDKSTMQDPPLVILPNLKLGAMETSVKVTNQDLQFRVTGMITEYRGRNYVLLQKVVVVPGPTKQF